MTVVSGQFWIIIIVYTFQAVTAQIVAHRCRIRGGYTVEFYPRWFSLFKVRCMHLATRNPRTPFLSFSLVFCLRIYWTVILYSTHLPRVYANTHYNDSRRAKYSPTTTPLPFSLFSFIISLILNSSHTQGEKLKKKIILREATSGEISRMNLVLNSTIFRTAFMTGKKHFGLFIVIPTTRAISIQIPDGLWLCNYETLKLRGSFSSGFIIVPYLWRSFAKRSIVALTIKCYYIVADLSCESCQMNLTLMTL